MFKYNSIALLLCIASISIAQVPLATPYVFNSGSQLFFHNNDTYQVFIGDALAGNINGTELYAGHGSAVVLAQDTFKAVNRIPSAVSEFLMYPQPANDIVNIRFQASVHLPETIRVFSISGVLLKKLIVHSKIIEVDVSNLSEGIYLIQFEKLGSSKKLVVSRK